MTSSAMSSSTSTPRRHRRRASSSSEHAAAASADGEQRRRARRGARSQGLQEGEELGPRRRRRAPEALAGRLGLAAVPEDRLLEVRARPSCRKRVWPLTVSTRPMPHSGGVRHSWPVASRSAVGSSAWRRCRQSGARRRGPRPCRGAGGRCRGGSSGRRGRRCRTARCAARRCGTTRSRASPNGLLAGRSCRPADVAAGRDGEGAGVEGDLVELRSSSSGSPPSGAVRHSGCSRVQGCSGRSDDVMPMSPAKAPAFCSSTVGTAAFQPKRPSTVSPRVAGSGTRLARPEMPSPSASSGSARARMSSSGTPRAGRRRTPPGRCGATGAGRDRLAVRAERSRSVGSTSEYGVPSAYAPGSLDRVITIVPSTGDAADGAVLELVAEGAVGLRVAVRRRPR